MNKLGLKGITQFCDPTHIHLPPDNEWRIFGKNFTDIVPGQIILDLDIDKMSELKMIINDRQNAKGKIHGFTGTKSIF